MSYPGQFGVSDASLIQAIALPASAGSVQTAAIDLGPLHGLSSRPEYCEALLVAPPLNATQLPAGKTMAYNILCDSAATPTAVLIAPAIVQTGTAVTGGAAAATYRFKLPSQCAEYLAVQATGGAAIGDCSGAAVVLQLLF